MSFIEPTLSEALKYFKRLQLDTAPLWGNMNAVGMVEHISDSLLVATGQIPNIKLRTPEDKLEKVRRFLFSDQPLPRNAKAPYGRPDDENRNATLEDAIAEFESRWHHFEKHYADRRESENLHPSFGMLNYEGWLHLHSKHLTHHFQQFGLISE